MRWLRGLGLVVAGVAGVAGPRLVAGGCWLLAGGCWLVAAGQLAIAARPRGPGAGAGRLAAAGDWRLVAAKAGRLVAGDGGCWLRGLRLAVQVAANSPKMAHTWWRRSSAISPDGPMTAAPNAPYRIRPPVVRDGLAGQYCTENGLVVYVRPILAPGPHAAVAASTGATDSRDAWLVADKCLIMSGMIIRPVWFYRQAKYSFN